MTAPARDRDPYEVLGVDPRASDREVRAAYLRLVKLHHPDHNGGSAESARRFEEVQAAYARVKELRSAHASPGPGTARGQRTTRAPAGDPRSTPATDPDIEARLAAMERELREAHAAREAARKAAREAARKAAQEAAASAQDAGATGQDASAKTFRRPTDEELGYIRTDDSFSKILADAADELSQRFDQAAESPRAKRVEDLIDELAEKLTGESKRRGEP